MVAQTSCKLLRLDLNSVKTVVSSLSYKLPVVGAMILFFSTLHSQLGSVCTDAEVGGPWPPVPHLFSVHCPTESLSCSPLKISVNDSSGNMVLSLCFCCLFCGWVQSGFSLLHPLGSLLDFSFYVWIYSQGNCINPSRRWTICDLIIKYSSQYISAWGI